jgi:hypothetical protein
MTRQLVCVVAVLVFSSTLLLAQAGSVGGIVSDPSGAAVTSAKITLTNVATGLSQSVSSDNSGYYMLPSIAPGNYRLTVEAAGFAAASQEFTLHADQAVTSNVQLRLASASEKVTVEAAPPQVNTTNSTLSEVVDQQRIVNLPLNGRNAATLTLLAPGTTGGPPTNDVDQGPTKTFPGAQTISTNGSRQNQVSYLLDGGDNVDQYTNVNLPFPFPDALEEFSLQTSNNAGGVVNVVTKSGTNQVSGDLFYFVRNAVFNARNYFASQDHGELIGAPYGPGACNNQGPCRDWLNPNSFQLPAPGTFGNTRKGAFIGPGSLGWDAGLMKEFPLSERSKLEFRGEFFNVLNHTVFNDPNNIVSGGGFGGIFGAADPRIGQLALKLSF